MAGAAGFEPAVPGLGGQCIIQAMLHARIPQSLPLKKSSEENAPSGTLSSDAIKHDNSSHGTWRTPSLHCRPRMGRTVGLELGTKEPSLG